LNGQNLGLVGWLSFSSARLRSVILQDDHPAYDPAAPVNQGGGLANWRSI